ncbi:unnamed protein product [Oncorhynchus mykiss]|uniref:Uncharacterized protein n=1 Tax=Oncorhynchus mykiss TaxID=8022 RepID=A0A060WH77_ONCMY|nr:unnamed protein product [Oncorhynchus mykiss]
MESRPLLCVLILSTRGMFDGCKIRNEVALFLAPLEPEYCHERHPDRPVPGLHPMPHLTACHLPSCLYRTPRHDTAHFLFRHCCRGDLSVHGVRQMHVPLH